jgi:hypothetical protein
MIFGKYSNLELIKLLESATEIFRNKKYYGRDHVEKYIGYGIHRSGFYGIKEGNDLTGLALNRTTFNQSSDVEIVIEGFVELSKPPVNNGSGGIVYTGYGLLEVNDLVIYDGRAGGGGSGTFINDIPVVLPIGKSLGKYVNGDIIPAAGKTFEEVLNDVAQDFLAPAFTSFSISQPSPIEVGATISGLKTFTWATSESANVEPDTISIEDSVVLGSGLSNDGTEDLTITTQTLTSAGSQTFIIRGEDTQGGNFSRNTSVVWQWRRYYGKDASTGPLNETQIEALPNTGLASGFSGNYSFPAGAGYAYFAFPMAWGTATTFKDTSTNLDVAMEPLYTVSVTNAEGISHTYNVHRSTNLLNGAITIGVS